MSAKEGQRHTAELSRLEQRKKELQEALGRLAKDEVEAQEVVDLAGEVALLEQEVETLRAQASAEKRARARTQMETGMTEPNNVRKAAAANREEAERQLDLLAKGIKRDDETFLRAYDRALDTEMGRALMQTRDDAQELERGGVTSMDLAEVHAKMAEN